MIEDMLKLPCKGSLIFRIIRRTRNLVFLNKVQMNKHNLNFCIKFIQSLEYHFIPSTLARGILEQSI